MKISVILEFIVSLFVSCWQFVILCVINDQTTKSTFVRMENSTKYFQSPISIQFKQMEWNAGLINL